MHRFRNEKERDERGQPNREREKGDKKKIEIPEKPKNEGSEKREARFIANPYISTVLMRGGNNNFATVKPWK